jgi:hypothetical protein
MQDTFAKLGIDSGEYFGQVLKQFGNDTDKAMKYMKEQGADIITGKYRDKVIDDIDLTDEEKKRYRGKESEFREGFRDYTKTIEDLRAKERRGEQLTERE